MMTEYATEIHAARTTFGKEDVIKVLPNEEIVRCCNCKYWFDDNSECERIPGQYRFAESNGFCSWGELGGAE